MPTITYPNCVCCNPGQCGCGTSAYNQSPCLPGRIPPVIYCHIDFPACPCLDGLVFPMTFGLSDVNGCACFGSVPLTVPECMWSAVLEACDSSFWARFSCGISFTSDWIFCLQCNCSGGAATHISNHLISHSLDCDPFEFSFDATVPAGWGCAPTTIIGGCQVTSSAPVTITLNESPV